MSRKTLIVVSASQSYSAQELGAVTRKQTATSAARSAAPSMTDIRNPHDQDASQRRAVAHERRSTVCLRSSSRPARAILGLWITRQQFLSERLHSRNLEAVPQSRTSRSSCAKRAIL